MTRRTRTKTPGRSKFTRTTPVVVAFAGARRPLTAFFERLAHSVTVWAGGSSAFAIACSVVLVWLVTGPIFQYSEAWQLVINTGTTIVTFLMVFLIQRAQNKESRAIQLKLNELVASMQGASNRLVGAEDLSEADLETLGRHYKELIARIRSEGRTTASHSIEEAASTSGSPADEDRDDRARGNGRATASR